MKAKYVRVVDSVYPIEQICEISMDQKKSETKSDIITYYINVIIDVPVWNGVSYDMELKRFNFYKVYFYRESLSKHLPQVRRLMDTFMDVDVAVLNIRSVLHGALKRSKDDGFIKGYRMTLLQNQKDDSEIDSKILSIIDPEDGSMENGFMGGQ